MTAGKPRYINFAQDSKGRIVSWGYWGKDNTIKEFSKKLSERELRGGAELKMVITIDYRKGRPGHFFMSEIHIDAEYPFRSKDSELIKSFVVDKFKNNREGLWNIRSQRPFLSGSCFSLFCHLSDRFDTKILIFLRQNFIIQTTGPRTI